MTPTTAMTPADPVPFAFVGCAKSEFYWKRPDGDSLPGHRAGSTIYNPIERYLLSSSSCKSVFPRDELTSACLAKAMGGCGHKVTLELDLALPEILFLSFVRFLFSKLCVRALIYIEREKQGRPSAASDIYRWKRCFFFLLLF